jgi:hypothetical protein
MSYTWGFLRWHAYVFTNARSRVWPALLVCFLIYPVTVIGSEDKETSCLRFADSAELYDRCLQEDYDDRHIFNPSAAPKNPDEKSCYCDIRKKHQVELRRRKQEERLQGKS